MSAPIEYTKRPVTIQAMRLDGGPTEAHEVYKWVERNTQGSYDTNDPTGEMPASGVSIDAGTGFMVIATLEGEMTAKPGDYIIRGVKGEFYPCKPDVFAMTYAARRDVLGETRDTILGAITNPLMNLVLERDPDTWAAGVAMELVPHADVEHEAGA